MTIGVFAYKDKQKEYILANFLKPTIFFFKCLAILTKPLTKLCSFSYMKSLYCILCIKYRIVGLNYKPNLRNSSKT